MNPLARIIDANLNRAREALRTLEDIARFALDDAALCQALKTLRHDLRAAADALASIGIDRGTLLASRDTPADVGTQISTPTEQSRAGLREVALAAGGRLTEALRTIEETAKAGGGAAGRFEAIRYRCYTIEQQLGLALGSGRHIQWRLCILLTESLCTHHPWERIAEIAIAGGADCLQLREKDLEDHELLSRAQRLVELAPAGVSIIINDRPDIALLAGAHGVHLGQTDLPPAQVRRLAGDRLLIGVSTASLEQARAAARSGADYCGIGPMFPSTTKSKPQLSGPGYLSACLADEIAGRLPHLAISGITPERARELKSLGCRGIAVSSYVCSAEDPEAATRALVQAMQ